MKNTSQTIEDIDIEETFEEGDFSDAVKDVDEDISDLEIDIAEEPDEGTKDDLRSLKGELLDLRSELSGDKDRAFEIYQRGPANHEELVKMACGLSFEEKRQAELIAKYGKGFGGVFLARCKAFMAGELDSHLISGRCARPDLLEGTKGGEVLRKGIISIFNRQNAPAAAVAVAIGVLTGGIGAPAAGVLMGGSIGRFSAELFASRHEGKARYNMLQAGRAHWLRLRELAADFSSEADAEAKKIKLQTFLDEYYLTEETSANRQKIQETADNFMAVNKRWDGIKNICQSLGGVAGLGGGLLGGHFAGYFSGIKGGLLVIKGQKVFHGVERINGVWHFIGKAGEVVGSGTVPHDQIATHVMNAANPAAAEVAARIYTAAAIKALPTLGALCLAGLRHAKTKKYDKETTNQFSYIDPRWQEGRQAWLAPQETRIRPEELTSTSIDSELKPEAEGIEAARARVAEAYKNGSEDIVSEDTLNDSQDDWNLSRRAAMIILARVNEYVNLNAKTEEEGNKLFIEKARELLKNEITVHWKSEKNPKDKKRSDLDGETALYLLRLAVGGNITVNYEPHGKFKIGHLNIDTGEQDGITFIPDPTKAKKGKTYFVKTAFIDHHGKESWVGQSAAFLTYKTLISLGLLEKTERLDKLVEFVNHADDMTGPFVDPKHFEKSHLTIAGLYRSMRANDVFKFFEKDSNPDPTRELDPSKKEFDKYGIIFKVKEKQENGSIVEKTVNLSEQQETNNNEAKNAVAKLEAEGKVIETRYGKLLVDEGNTVKVPSAALLKGYIHLKYDENGFFVSGMPRELELPEGRRMRNMWLHRAKPTVSLQKIIDVFKEAPAEEVVQAA